MTQGAHKAWLGKCFDEPCTGTVHSVFERVVNVAMHTDADIRLLALCDPALPRLPDAIAIPRDELQSVQQGMLVGLSGDLLTIGKQTFGIVRDQSWSGRIAQYGRPIDAGEFLRYRESFGDGLAHVPMYRRMQALNALCTPDAVRWIGLGAGLTPSYDDMCVGVMAVCHALGKPIPFAITSREDTTDISLRYLLLAQEGRFGEPVCDVINALFGKGSLVFSVNALKCVGSTSGMDMLCGMRMMLDKHMNEGEDT